MRLSGDVFASELFTVFIVCCTMELQQYTTMKAENKSKIAVNMKKYRRKNGISQNKLSELSGVTYHTIIKIESGVNKNPTIETLGNIAKALEVGVDDLIK